MCYSSVSSNVASWKSLTNGSFHGTIVYNKWRNIPLPSLITEGPEGCSFLEFRFLRCLRFSRSKFYFSLMGHNTIHQQQLEDKLKALVTSTFRFSCVFLFSQSTRLGAVWNELEVPLSVWLAVVN
jgi:hypothetical protein